MKIEGNLVKKLYEVCETVSINAIKAIYEYQKSNTYLPSYYKYPEEFFKGIEKEEVYKEVRENIPAIKCGITFFHRSNIIRLKTMVIC